ncbi:MAG: DEAD/DEAH box helicase, partial [Magnetococcales bacterium]|nr:DEAD/DEAH box helicase [Magnetococcales bacterium]
MPPTNPTTELRTRLRHCLILDRPGINRKLDLIQRRSARSQPVDRLLQEVQSRIENSCKLYEQRHAERPIPQFPDHLPVVGAKDEIAQAIEENQVVVLCGETGSGKTTQLPKILLELGLSTGGLIGLTQPRRIAALGITAHLSDELKDDVGGAVGSKIRFHERTSPRTHIKVMTDGILLAECQGDPDLLQYQAIIIDEAHERSLNIDFLLGYLKQLLNRRPELKVVISSATIDTDKFSRHFDHCPIIEVSGRTYPVEIRYRPLVDQD